ncbi:hypothetical protein L345_04870, partial [Ophiophagus hannah]
MLLGAWKKNIEMKGMTCKEFLSLFFHKGSYTYMCICYTEPIDVPLVLLPLSESRTECKNSRNQNIETEISSADKISSSNYSGRPLFEGESLTYCKAQQKQLEPFASHTFLFDHLCCAKSDCRMSYVPQAKPAPSFPDFIDYLKKLLQAFGFVFPNTSRNLNKSQHLDQYSIIGKSESVEQQIVNKKTQITQNKVKELKTDYTPLKMKAGEGLHERQQNERLSIFELTVLAKEANGFTPKVAFIWSKVITVAAQLETASGPPSPKQQRLRNKFFSNNSFAQLTVDKNFPGIMCFIEDKSSKVAWLNRSGIIFAGQDKWSLDPRVELQQLSLLEYSLRIQKVDIYDEGSYTCSVQTLHHPKTSQVYLIVQDSETSLFSDFDKIVEPWFQEARLHNEQTQRQVPPKISNISSDVTVNEGSNVTLVCMANGRPEPVITWRHLTPTGREFEGEEEFLEILGITREQSGKYECKAANEVSTADVKQVRVTSPGEGGALYDHCDLNCPMGKTNPPTITESKSNVSATGRPVSLKCAASAVPTPDFEWYRDDTRINSANGLEIRSIGSQSFLTVTNVTEEHYGNYTCVATNKLGITNASLFLY